MTKTIELRLKIGDMLDRAFKAIPVGFAIFDADERLAFYNEAYRQICAPVSDLIHIGMKAEEILRAIHKTGNYPLAKVGDPESELWIESRMKDFRAGQERPQVFPYAKGWLRVENLRISDGSTVAVRIDVTELKEAELARDRQRMEYFALVQNIPDFITRISVDKAYIFVNDRYAELIGLPAKDIIGRPLSDYVPQKDYSRLMVSLDALTPEMPMMTVEQHRHKHDGTVLDIFWSNIAIFENGQAVEFVAVGRDISELKRQEERIAQQSVELRRKNEALNQFTGTVSHDLKAPLRHLSMFSEMICEDLESGNLDNLPVYTKHLRNSARRMNILIDSLLDYAQITDRIGRWQIVDMACLVADALVDLDHHVEEANGTVVFDDLPLVKGDPELLKRLVQNIIGNAIKYRKPNTAPVIKIYGRRQADTVKITFEDNGIGIDPRFSSKIFEVFQRLHRDETVYQGTGIGLALAKRIAESHDGRIDLDTTFSEGARFVVTLRAS